MEFLIDQERDLNNSNLNNLVFCRKYFTDVNIICYNNEKSVLEDENLDKADLFIIDLLLKNECDGLKLSQTLYERYIKVPNK